MSDSRLPLKMSNSVFMKQRKRTEGPESQMVDDFLHGFEDMFAETGLRFSVFVEPYIDIGFPDVIGVLWSEESAKNWSEQRLHVTNRDIRLLNHLSLQGGQKLVNQIQTELGSTERDVILSLSRLLDANLIVSRGNGVEARNLGDIFAPKKIIAIEAKMADWRGATAQASLNKWFASESYVLFPGDIARYDVLSYTKSNNIGMIAKVDHAFVSLSKSEELEIPKSYGSWLVNEWLMRAEYGNSAV